MSLLLLGPAPDPAAASGGTPFWVYAVIAGAVLLVGLVVLLVAARRKEPEEQLCRNCKRIILADWDKCRFCGTPTREVRAELQFVSGPLQGTSVSLDGDVTTIGSVAGNRVVLTDTGVSRKHVGIKKVEGGYELADLGSTNGVYVNGERVARRKLEVGDVIRVGTTEMVFRA